MGQPFTQKDLDRMGLVKGKDGVYAKPATGNKKVEYPGGYRIMKGLPTMPLPQLKVKKGRPASSEAPTVDSIEKGEGWCRITLAGVIKGLNGTGGLTRSHWAVAKKVKDQFIMRIAALNPPKFHGKVRLTFTRFTVRYMDLDNLCSTIKHPLDGLKKNGVIVDDSPDYVVEFLPKQQKSRQKDQRTEILIEQL